MLLPRLVSLVREKVAAARAVGDALEKGSDRRRDAHNGVRPLDRLDASNAGHAAADRPASRLKRTSLSAHPPFGDAPDASYVGTDRGSTKHVPVARLRPSQ